jgi:parallel beta-helix repeat protein
MNLRTLALTAAAFLLPVTLFAATYTVTTTAKTGPGSLEAALTAAEASHAASTIVFNVPGGPDTTHFFYVDNGYEPVTVPIIIDGTTQPNYRGYPVIRIYNAAMTSGAIRDHTLDLRGGSSTVRGLSFLLTTPDEVDPKPLLRVSGDNNTVENNFFGTEGTVGYYFGGAVIEGSNNVVTGNVLINSGGRQPRYRPASVDLTLIGGSGNRVEGNFIGTDVQGNTAFSEAGHGITLIDSSNNTIGGTTPSTRNVFSGHLVDAINISGGSGNRILGNYIGVNASGAGSLPGTVGIAIANSSSNVIGGEEAGAGNIIANSNDRGLSITGSSTGNQVVGNSFFSNAALGIDLDLDGVTDNDSGDGDGGANGRQNFPVLTSATGAPSALQVSGSLNSRPNSAYRLHFYASPQCHGTGFGEGRFYLGAANANTNAAGDTLFFADLPPAAQSWAITATATDSGGNTSEFSRCAFVNLSAHGPVITSFSPASAPRGASVAISGQYFTGANSVAFGNEPASFLVLNDGSLTAVVPATATTGRIRIITPSGVGISDTDFVVSECSAPSIPSIEPSGARVPKGTSVTLHATASGTSVRYAWFLGRSGDTSRKIGESVNATFETGPLAGRADYWVRAENECGRNDSIAVTIDVCEPPAILSLPASRSVAPHGDTTVSVDAGPSPLTYQWYHGPRGDTRSPIAGMTGKTLTLRGVTVQTTVWVRLANDCATVDSPEVPIVLQGRSRTSRH